MRPIWFQGHVAYSMAKYNMSLCALGMAAEFKGQVAVNCIWPKTAIWTAAMNMLGGEESAKKSRTPQIMGTGLDFRLFLMFVEVFPQNPE